MGLAVGGTDGEDLFFCIAFEKGMLDIDMFGRSLDWPYMG